MDRIARTRAWLPRVEFSHESVDEFEAKGRDDVATLIRRALASGTREDGTTYGVMLLTGPDDDDTVQLAQPIVNDTTTSTGKPWGWVIGQRYTQLTRLSSGARYTSEL